MIAGLRDTNEHVPPVLFGDVVGLAHVHEVHNRLGGEEGKSVDDLHLLGVPITQSNVLLVLQHLLHLEHDLHSAISDALLTCTVRTHV